MDPEKSKKSESDGGLKMSHKVDEKNRAEGNGDNVPNNPRNQSMEQILDKARGELLDLSRKNRLIHLKENSRVILPIVDEKPAEVFSLLVDQETSMRFLARTPKGDSNVENLEEKEDEEGETEDNNFQIPDTEIGSDSVVDEEYESSDNLPAARHIDKFLQTNLNQKKLSEKLAILSRETQNALDEQGTHLLFIALGFLEWTEDGKPENSMTSPLVLVPVDLERTNILSPFRLRYYGDDIQTNLCLEKKLTDEFGLKFPEESKIESRQDYEEYIAAFESQLEGKTKWKISDRIALGLFTFTKFLMYRDLNPAQWKSDLGLINNPLIKALLDGAQWNSNSSQNDEDIETGPKNENEYLVLDSDFSQKQVIKAANNGLNLIIQGPPGTGKSQTITNLIAGALGNNKKVLFVSEKRAALEVVKKRLDESGIGDYCLELHSKDSSKRGFLDSLQKTVNSPKATSPRDKNDFRKYSQTIDSLEQIGEDLLNPISNTGLSPYYLMGQYIKLSDGLPKIELDHSIFQEPLIYEEMERMVNEFESAISKVGTPGEHSFRDIEATDILPNELEECRFLLQELLNQFQEFSNLTNQIIAAQKLNNSDSIGESVYIIDLWDRLQDNPFSEPKELESIDWSFSRELVQSFIEAYLKYSQKHKKLDEFYQIKLIPWHDLDKHKAIISKHSGSFMRIFNKEYKISCDAIRACLKTKSKMSGEDLLKAIDFLKNAKSEKESFESTEKSGPFIVGPVWRGIETPEEVAIPRMRWVQQTQPIIQNKIIEPLALAELAFSDSWDQTTHLVSDLENLSQLIKSSLESFLQILHAPRMRWQSILEDHMDNFMNKLKSMHEDIDLLWDWVEFKRSEHLLEESPVAGIIELAKNGEVDETNALKTFQYNYYKMLLDMAFKERESLSNFRKESIDSTIKQFRNLDLKLLYHARQRLAYELSEKCPRLIEGLSGNSSELGVIQREIHKKRRIKPIRRLLLEAGSLVQRIKPCFMMSPLSVAQFLPPGEVDFDLVIFDEASQMKPEDALGAIARSKQLVVVGDSKQLPPTRFFSRLESEEVDWEDNDDSLSDLESILDACNATGMPSMTLTWHYRSRHDSLIATSNREFYDNKLTIFPSPFERSNELGLGFEKIENGIFERGKSGTNPVEARAVAEAVIEHAKTNPEDSLGVGTFNIKQQHLLLNEIEKLRRKEANPELEKYFLSEKKEPFFVKNLENIQGDERDVIFLSVCYAKHDPEKSLSMNFGPLNQEGGERRLNVLITRAKKKCLVFSSVSSDEIDLDRTNSKGVQSLKSFLHFAEYGARDFSESRPSEDYDPFEFQLGNKLNRLGYQVVSRVGAGVFRLNYGVRHPDAPNQFVLGIECDGTAYENSTDSRERERTRPFVLKSMGWNIHRVWTTEFIKNPDVALQRIEKAILAASTQNSKKSKSIESEIDEIKFEDELEREDISSIGEIYSSWSGPMPKTGRTLAKEIVKVEGPIHEEDLLNKMRIHLGISRMTPKNRTEIQNHIFSALRDKVIERLDEEDDFYVSKGYEIKGTIPRHRDSLPGEADYISSIEILSAAEKIYAKAGETPKDELVKNVSLVLGYKMLSSKIQARIEDALNRSNLKKIGLKLDHRERVSKSPDLNSIFQGE